MLLEKSIAYGRRPLSHTPETSVAEESYFEREKRRRVATTKAAPLAMSPAARPWTVSKSSVALKLAFGPTKAVAWGSALAQ